MATTSIVKMTYDESERIVGCLLGTAIGDALGLPFEGLSASRRERMFGTVDGYRLLPGRGLVSDDTEHACMMAQCLIEAWDDCERFEQLLAKRLRWWSIMLPAGIGLATLRACGKLWLGFSPESSGVVSAGNGPAMRSPILGALFGTEKDDLWNFVEASTRITHRDRKAFCGAYAAAWATAWAAEQRDIASFADALAEQLAVESEAELLLERIRGAWRSATAGESTPTFAAGLGMKDGVSGFIYDTVPIAIHGWMRHPEDFRSALTGVIECGGDADSTGALVGAITGSQVGARGIPIALLDGIAEWPRTVSWMRNVGETLANAITNDEPTRAPRLNGGMVLGRNIAFAMIVLAHGFRRLAPPY